MSRRAARIARGKQRAVQQDHCNLSDGVRKWKSCSYLAAARVMAQKTCNLKISEKEKLIRSFRAVVCRKPSDKELSMLEAYYTAEKNKFSKNKLQAQTFLKAGEFEEIKTTDLAQAAALMQVNQMLFNLDETTIK